ncbi:AEC family transporter [Clostridium sp. D2Q-11]|uniref:AEC family transporter n=1 Tax=Anaeromonas frigoriresistens TaxID=2683708 RepID=A0A942UUM6_9FIRM|nr:AEC family transporter [Anaeromonas frigoriresistens]MBS4538305.1 AEC family transporter [Anaeromonas frigoriresistens]
MDLLSVLSQVSVLFILLIIGIVLRKVNILNDTLGKGLSNLIIYATLPALLITSMNYDFSPEMLNNGLLILAIGPLVYIFVGLIAYLYVKINKIENPEKGIYLFITIFPNVGFMGYPVVEVVFGKIGIFYAALFNLWFNILLWTLGIILVSTKEKTKINLKMLLNPGTISIAIGLSLFLFSVKLPGPIYDSLNSLGGTTIPLAMLVIGSMLGESSVHGVLKNKLLIGSTFVRLILMPLPLLIVLSLLPLPTIVVGTAAIVMAMPSAANAAIFARRYDSEYKLASEGVFLSTLLSIITIPAFISILIKVLEL